MLDFIAFGSGSSGNSYCLLTPERTGLLIDAGVGIRKLKKYFFDFGLSGDKISSVIVTHDHADHVKSVGGYSIANAADVYATEKVHAGINNNHFVRRKIPREHIKIIEKNRTFNIGDFEITPFDVPHDSSDNVGYRIRYKGITFCIMTDVGHVTDEMMSFVSEADYLVIEANYDREMLDNGPYPEHLKQRILGPSGHLSNKECGEVLAEHSTPRLKHVWLCHLSKENNHPELARKTVENILRGYGIVAGADFQLDVLKRQVPSGVYHLIP